MRKIVSTVVVVVYALLTSLMQSCSPERKNPVVVAVRHPLGLGWSDTLVLFAQTSECGEWGGHRDVIKVYLDSEEAQKKDLGYEATDSVPRVAALFRDTLCPANRPGQHLFLAGRQVLTIPQERAVFRYMQKLLPYGLKTPYPSHAGNTYSVSCNSDLGNSVAISIYDTRNEWHEYMPLRRRLFPKQQFLDAKKLTSPPAFSPYSTTE